MSVLRQTIVYPTGEGIFHSVMHLILKEVAQYRPDTTCRVS